MADPSLYPSEEAERRRALELEEFFDEEAGHELRRAAFHELRDDPDYVSALLMTGQGPLARRVMRALLPVAMVYPKRRYRINPADAEEGRRKVSLALDRIEAEVGPSGYLVGDEVHRRRPGGGGAALSGCLATRASVRLPGTASLGVVGVAHAPPRRRMDHGDVPPPPGARPR